MEQLFSVFIGGLAAVISILTCRRASAAIAGRRERLRVRRESVALTDLRRERLHGLYFRAASCLEPVPPSLRAEVARRNERAREMLDAAVRCLEHARKFAMLDRPEGARKARSRAMAAARKAKAALDERDRWLGSTVEEQRLFVYERYGCLKRAVDTIAVDILRRAREGAPLMDTGSALRRLAISVTGVRELIARDPRGAMDTLTRQAQRLFELTRDARTRLELWRQLRTFERALPERAACVRAMAITASRALSDISGLIRPDDAVRHRAALAAAEQMIAAACRQIVETKALLASAEPIQYQTTIRKLVCAETTLAKAETSALFVIELHGTYAMGGFLPGGMQAAMVN